MTIMSSVISPSYQINDYHARWVPKSENQGESESVGGARMKVEWAGEWPSPWTQSKKIAV
jgi:hypothetical protein